MVTPMPMHSSDSGGQLGDIAERVTSKNDGQLGEMASVWTGFLSARPSIEH